MFYVFVIFSNFGQVVKACGCYVHGVSPQDGDPRSAMQDRDHKRLCTEQITRFMYLFLRITLAELLRRVPTNYMGFPREKSNLSGDDFH